jgi:type III restriction enzyme
MRRSRRRVEGFSIKEDDHILAAPLAPWHLRSDEDSAFPLASPRDWKGAVVRAVIARAEPPWLVPQPVTSRRRRLARNCVSRREREQAFDAPDFVLFHKAAGEIRVSIVGLHGRHLKDADVKQRALASFATAFGADFHRAEAVTEVDGRLKVIDMQLAAVRDADVAGNRSRHRPLSRCRRL